MYNYYRNKERELISMKELFAVVLNENVVSVAYDQEKAFELMKQMLLNPNITTEDIYIQVYSKDRQLKIYELEERVDTNE